MNAGDVDPKRCILCFKVFLIPLGKLEHPVLVIVPSKSTGSLPSYDVSKKASFSAVAPVNG
jgi:hypothetical protein